MMAGESMEDSLLQLIVCMSCSEEVDLLKVLPCQHLVCLYCLGRVSKTEFNFQCPKCSKELPIPNGGFDQLPDSYVTTQIAELVKQKRQAIEVSQAGDSSRAGKNIIPISAKDLDLFTLKKELREEIASGKRWQKCAKDVIKQQSAILDEIPSTSEKTKKSIMEYQQTTDRKCREKLHGVSKGSSDTQAELKEGVNSLQPKLEKMRDVMRHIPDLTKKLSGKHYTAKDVAEGERLLEKLTQLNRDMDKESFGTPESYMQISSGDSVRIGLFGDEENLAEFVNGEVSHSSVGIFVGIKTRESSDPAFPFRKRKKETPLAIFPEKFDWEGPKLGCLTPSLTKAKLPFIEDRVRVKSTVKSPHFSWKGVKAGKSQGVLKDIEYSAEAPAGDLVVIIDFPRSKGWKGLYSEIELMPGCGLMAGDKVRVSSSIPEPSRGWAGVTGSSVGKVKAIKGKEGKEEVTVDFPECKDWVGLATELELSSEPGIGDKVQVKLSVTNPDLGWGGICHDDVGTLQEVLKDDKLGTVAQVYFSAKKKRWSCKLKELEVARYQSPDYDTTEQVDGEEFIRAFQQAMLMQMSASGLW